MKLSVIIVSYNVKYYLEQCLMSLNRALNGIEADIFVVDNNSMDGSLQYLNERFPNVKFINNNQNTGFSRANNIAIRQSNAQYVLLLNPDTIVGESAISSALAFMDEHKQTGGLGVRMINADGTDAPESRRGFPTPWVAFCKFSGLGLIFPKSHKFGHYYMGYLDWDKPAKIEVMSGAFCMLRRESLNKVGLLDEDFFMYGEDIDLSYRLIKGGFENWYLPIKILHYKGVSTKKASIKFVNAFYNAMLIFLSKHYQGTNAFFYVPIKLAIYLKALISLTYMLVDNVCKRLGLGTIYRSNHIKNYIFIGNDEAIRRCKDIVDKRGLKAQFIIGNAQTMPNGHNDLHDIRSNTCVVYDIDAYSFDEIFNIFAVHPKRNIVLGTFNIKTGLIINKIETLV